MPYTKTPTNDTFSQEDIPLTREIISRQSDPSGAKDELFLNCFIELARNKSLEDNRHFIIKRAGSSIYITPSVSSEIRGLYFWADYKYVVYAQDNDIYLYKTSDGTTITCSNVFGTTTGTVGFCSYLYDTGAVVIIATDGTTLITIDSTGVVTTCVDADLPTPHIPKPIFLDGYLFLVKSGTASIYNSDLNDPMTWTAGNLIDAEMDGDQLITIEKLNNYIIAFGSTSIEYFWDAGIATGSPLQRNDTPVKINQYVGGLAKYQNALFYIGATEGGQLDVFRLQDFQIEPIGSPTITRYLAQQTTSFSNFKGGMLSCLGHSFYVLNVDGYTFVYDVDTKHWGRWSFSSNANFNITNTTQLHSSSQVGSLFTISTARTIYLLDDTKYQDNNTNFNVIVVTEPADFGTLNRKTMSRFALFCDRPSTNSTIDVSWSDDDFQSYSSPVSLELNQDIPSIYRLGSFRQRIFKLSYSDNFPLRMQRLQVFINKGRQ